MRVVLLALLLCAACSESKNPPPLGDTDSGKIYADALPPEGDGAPCSIALEGCPCKTPGEMQYCGRIYRTEDKKDCELGYATCQADGGFGKCIGAGVFVPQDQ